METYPRMVDKPKRKNDPDAIDFVTGYSVDDCVERLERGPAYDNKPPHPSSLTPHPSRLSTKES